MNVTNVLQATSDIAPDQSELRMPIPTMPDESWGVVRYSYSWPGEPYHTLESLCDTQPEAEEKAALLQEAEGVYELQTGGDEIGDAVSFSAQMLALRGLRANVTFIADYEIVREK